MSVAVERIDDLRTDQRAGPFWEKCNRAGYIRTAIIVKDAPACPSKSTAGYPIDNVNAKKLWGWIQTFRVEAFDPPEGQEIRVDVDTWSLIDGGKRASALYALELPVPAIVIENPRKYRSAGELEFSGGMWRWR